MKKIEPYHEIRSRLNKSQLIKDMTVEMNFRYKVDIFKNFLHKIAKFLTS